MENLLSQDSLLYILLPTVFTVIYFIKLGESRVTLTLIYSAYMLYYGIAYGFYEPVVLVSTTVILATITVVLTNLIIDPLGVFFLIHKKGFNSYKSYSLKHMGTAKSFRLARLKPDIIILGTSRASMGMPGTHKIFTNANKSSFNASVFSISVTESLEYLKFAQQNKPLDTVLIGLDFYTFNTQYRRASEAEDIKHRKYDQLVLETEKDKNNFRSLPFLIKTTLTNLEVYKKSRHCFKNRRRGYPLYVVSKSGLVHPNQQTIKKFGGLRKVFDESDNAFFKIYDRAPDEEKFTFESTETSTSKFDGLNEIIKYGKENDIKIFFYISPNHARQMHFIKALGLNDKHQEWKRRLTNAIDSQSNDDNKLALFDFSGFNSITTETIPSNDDASGVMKYYIDSSHYNANAGDLIISKIFNDKNSEVPKDFGIKLTKENIEEHLKNIEVDRNKYGETNKEEIEKADALLEIFNKKNQN